ncbi:hypothetical protein LT493_35410 [Streptomyces tricolor]|nr:hypothetical protein [Streptomyces tricolor]
MTGSEVVGPGVSVSGVSVSGLSVSGGLRVRGVPLDRLAVDGGGDGRPVGQRHRQLTGVRPRHRRREREDHGAGRHLAGTALDDLDVLTVDGALFIPQGARASRRPEP